MKSATERGIVHASWLDARLRDRDTLAAVASVAVLDTPLETAEYTRSTRTAPEGTPEDATQEICSGAPTVYTWPATGVRKTTPKVGATAVLGVGVGEVVADGVWLLEGHTALPNTQVAVVHSRFAGPRSRLPE